MTPTAMLSLIPVEWLVLAIFSVIFGCCIGSFLNVCIYRIPLEQSVVKPRSHCMRCGKLIPWYHNLPVISYFVLRGRCAYCKAPFSFRYAAVELLTGFLFLLLFCKFPPGGCLPPLGMQALYPYGSAPEQMLRFLPLLPIYWFFICGLLVGTFIDFDHFILPDRITIGGMVAGPVLSALVPVLQSRLVLVPSGVGSFLEPALAFAGTWYEGVMWSLIGLAVGFIPLQCIRLGATWLFRKRGRIAQDEYAMGFGDIKLIGAIGAFLGWQAALFSIVVAAAIGSLVALPLVLARRRKMLDCIPFGPYLSLAALIWILWGHRLVYAYLTFLPPWAEACRI